MTPPKDIRENLRTWIEIDASAARKNYDAFRRLIGSKVKLWSVVKSNAYGHGLFAFSKLADRLGVDGFCLDSLVEGIALRRAGIKKFILVLGFTIPARLDEAAQCGVTVTVADFDALRALARAAHPPEFHLKIDTGLHRQGFYPEELPRAIRLIASTPAIKSRLTGIYTHFAAAKDITYPGYTEMQFAKFEKAVALFKKAGFKNLTAHAAATGGVLVGKKYHLDAVRIGIGLYGVWPSKELALQRGDALTLHPILSWRTVVGQVKRLKRGDYVGYNLTERVTRPTMAAVLPVGYWHGLPWALSGCGEVVVHGRRARILGRVSMDMAVVAIPEGRARGGSRAARAGDVVTLIGRDGREQITAEEQADRAGSTSYEFLTRLNPLMERIVV